MDALYVAFEDVKIVTLNCKHSSDNKQWTKEQNFLFIFCRGFSFLVLSPFLNESLTFVALHSGNVKSQLKCRLAIFFEESQESERGRGKKYALSLMLSETLH